MSGARAIIAKIRDGATPSAEELRWFARGLAQGEVSDAQAGAFAMAVLCRGLGEAGRVALTLAMRDSGERLRWDLPGAVVDKHSTGGIGDCTSLILAPALAACGVYVPMISGRGLGHTGGTLDKLEAIAGFRTDLGEAELRRVVRDAGCAIVAASAEIAPADRRLYAVRDVTATVESVELITASILSKKLAAGLQALVLDVKTGSGAFLPGREQAAKLARALVETAKGAGCATSALITDMDQPLARSAGNALEVAEAVDVLTGRLPAGRLRCLSIALGGEVLALCGVVTNRAEGEARVTEALTSGRAAEVFGRMVAAQHGPADFLEDPPRHLPRAAVVLAVEPEQTAHVTRIDSRAVGEVVVGLGGGRQREGQGIDPSVGLSDLAAPGMEVGPGRPLGCVHAATQEAAEAAARALRAAYVLGEAGTPAELLQDRIS